MFRMTTQYHRALLWVLACLMAAMCPGVTSAQAIEDIEPYIGSTNVDDGIDAIRAFARVHLQGMQSDNPADRAAARQYLREPVLEIDVPSVAFRLAYDAELRATLMRIINGSNVPKAVNALYVAGDLGTWPSIRRLLLDSLSSDDESIRYASAVALRRSLQIIDAGSGTINAQQVLQIIQAISQAMVSETNVLVVDALIRALESLQSDSDTQVQSNIALCQGVIGHFRNTPTLGDPYQVTMTLVRAIVVVRGTHINRVGAISKELGILTGALCGQAMVELTRIGANTDRNDARLRQAIANGLKASETLAGLAGESLVRNFPITEGVRDSVDDWLEGRPFQPVIAAVNEWVAAGGRLTRSPFNLNADDFAD
jgi:hypothetical protein